MASSVVLRAFAGLMLCSVAGCAGATEISHPDSTNLDALDRTGHPVIERAQSVPHPTLGKWAARLMSARELWSVGAHTAVEGEFIGRVADVVLTPEGDVWLLDSRMNRLSGYSKDGKFRFAFSGYDGHGEGSYRVASPVALERSSAGDLLILERSGDLIAITPSDVGDRAIRRVFRFRGQAEGLCALGEGLLVRTWNEQGTVARVEFSGEVQATFGPAYRHPSEFVRRKLSTCIIGCLSESNVVVSMLDRLPAVFGHTREGEPLWTARLAQLEPKPAVEVRRGERTALRSVSEASYDAPLSIVGLDEDVVLLQVARRVPGRTAPDAIHTYLVNARTGAGAYVGKALPHIMSASAGRMVGAEHGSIERIRVFAIPEE